MPTLYSSAISKVRYDAATSQLRITFRPGKTYTFYRVPPAIYHGLITANSAGGYYHAHIQGRYR